MEEEGEVIGVAIFYDGAKARELDAPLERAAAKKSGDSNYSIPTEAEASEFYLDTFSVSSRCQGKGYGCQLIEAGCDRARKLGHHRIALLVEVDHAAAKRLYERLGFCTDYTKRIAGQEYFHMVRSLCARAVLRSRKNSWWRPLSQTSDRIHKTLLRVLYGPSDEESANRLAGQRPPGIEVRVGHRD